jgi:penicillin amidase
MLPPGERPAIIDPPSGRAWTANAPVVGGAAGRLLGDGGSRHDGRAFQIGSRLQSRDTWDEIALFELQLDSETLFLRRWRDLALGLLETGVPPDPASGRARFRGAIAAWDGHARRDSTGHRLVRQFRREAADAVMARLLAPCRAAFAGFSPADVDYEEALWALVSQRPSWAAREDGWEGELLECVDRVVASLPGGAASVGVEKWGEHNRLDMCHPLARGMAFLRGWLAAPRDGVSGDSYAPNALYRYHGPSQRMVVAPGREESGIMNLPGGQSGHPLSPYFLAGHAAWVEGWPTRFLPGETVHRLVCAPAATGP